MPFEALRWELAERFGWTLQQVDALTVADWHEWEQIKKGRYEATQPPKKEKIA